jgi:hypothetical protein
MRDGVGLRALLAHHDPAKVQATVMALHAALAALLRSTQRCSRVSRLQCAVSICAQFRMRCGFTWGVPARRVVRRPGVLRAGVRLAGCEAACGVEAVGVEAA